MKTTNDLSASQYRRKDLVGEACALVKVQLAATGATFEGNVIPPVENKSGEYWVYLSKGSRELRIKHSSFVPLHVIFSDYGINGVQSLTTYDLTLIMPQGTATVQTQKLIIDYTPSNAIVVVDSKPHQGNGHLELTLPVGTHDYQIVAMGYDTVEGSVKLNASSPRTITEKLTANKQQTTNQTLQSTLTPSTPQTSVVQKTDAKPSDDSQPSAPQPSSASVFVSGSSYETITVNGVSFNMIRVEGGTFQMGATSEQGSNAYHSEKPAHRVTLSAFSIGETEVTQELWEAVMGRNPSKYKGAKHPVENVSWKDCQKFIRKLNAKTGRQFRLPTEAEWEYAARGGGKSQEYKYSGSNTIDDVAWYTNTTNSEGTRVVKSKQGNELGLYDMSGNVYEWCQDRYGKEYYSIGSLSNPTGSSSGSDRVIRGGSWNHDAWYCRVSHRSYDSPGNTLYIVGLRLAL